VISGAHVIIHSKDCDADRAFFRDVLELPSVDAGDGWLIFALPPAEAAVHLAEENGAHELYLMCDDVKAVIKKLRALKIMCSPTRELNWGILAMITLPGGGELGLYQPKHPIAAKGRK
jgi:predicted enzyme related to lactoylglutathione lyase